MLDWKRWGDGKSLFGSGGGWGDLGGTADLESNTPLLFRSPESKKV